MKSFQRSAAAWGVAAALLGRQDLSQHTYLFAAQTLKTKLSFDFAELAGVDLLGFKDNLLNLCLKFADLTLIMRQLAQCLAIVGIQLVELWGALMFSEINAQFSWKTGLLLELLKCFAEELEDESIVVDIEQVRKFRQVLAQHSGLVFEFLQGLGGEYSITVLETFLAWVQVGLDEEIVQKLPQSPLLALCFSALHDPSHFTTASFILAELIRATGDYEKYADVVKTVVAQLLLFKQAVFTAVVQGNELLCEGYARIFCTLGRRHVDLIIREEAVELLEIVETLLRANSLRALKDANEFWDRFARQLAKLPPAELAVKKEKFAHVFSKIIPVCLSNCKLHTETLYAASYEEPLDEEIEEKRATYAETITDLAYSLDPNGTYSLLTENLLSLVPGTASCTEAERLAQVEALVRCLTALSELISAETPALQNSITAAVYELWPVYQLNYTVCVFLKCVSCKLCPGTLSQVLNYLLKCLGVPALETTASVTIREICTDNTQSLAGQVESLIEMHKIAITLKNKNHEFLLEGVCDVIWKPPSSALVVAIASHYATPLKLASETNNFVQTEVAENLDCLGIIFKTAQPTDVPKQGVYAIYTELWPLLKTLFEVYSDNTDMVERLCRVVKHSMRKLSELFREFIDELIQVLVVLSAKYCHSSLFYIAENIVRTYGNHGNFAETMETLLNHMSSAALTKLTSLTAMSAAPDLTEDFFGMGIRYLNYAPFVIGTSPALPNILAAAKMGIGIAHKEAAKCIYTFLELLVDSSSPLSHKYIQQVESLYNQQYAGVLGQLVWAVLEVPNKQIFSCICDLAIRILLNVSSSDWLLNALKQVPHDCLTDTEKQKILVQSQDPKSIDNWLGNLYSRARRRALRNR